MMVCFKGLVAMMLEDCAFVDVSVSGFYPPNNGAQSLRGPAI